MWTLKSQDHPYTSGMLGCRMRCGSWPLVAELWRTYASFGLTLLDRCWTRLRRGAVHGDVLKSRRVFWNNRVFCARYGVKVQVFCARYNAKVLAMVQECALQSVCLFCVVFGHFLSEFAMLVCAGMLGVRTHRQHVLVRQELAWYINENTKRVYRWNAFRGGRDCYPTA